MFLAQANIAIFRWSLGDPRMSEFAAQIPTVMELAEKADGFIWQFTEDYTPRNIGTPWDHPLLFFNLSVWRDLESLQAFVRSPNHFAIMKDREAWIRPVSCASSAMWPIEESIRPSVDDAIHAITSTTKTSKETKK